MSESDSPIDISTDAPGDDPGGGDSAQRTRPQAVVVRCEQLTKIYGRGDIATRALDRVDLELRAGEVVALTGPSGSGKSTLLHILGTMDVPTSGSATVLDHELGRLDDEAASVFRNRHLGFIFQFFHLVPSLTARENIALPGRLAGRPRAECDAVAADLARRVGLGEHLERFPDQLSGGQRQRVALARALLNSPALVLADEPTGNLDHAAGGEVMDLLIRLGKEEGVAVLVATHDPAVTGAADREIALLDGCRVEGPRAGAPADHAAAPRR